MTGDGDAVRAKVALGGWRVLSLLWKRMAEMLLGRWIIDGV